MIFYASDLGTYRDQVLSLQRARMHSDPSQPGPYHQLARLYSENRQVDEAWCVSQALHVLGAANAEERRVYTRHRSQTAAAAQQAFSQEDWSNLAHPAVDTWLTAVFAAIQPAVVAARSQSLQTLGYAPQAAVALGSHYAPVSQNLYYAGGVLGMQPPPTFEAPNVPGGLSFLYATEPSILLGATALSTEVPQQAAAYIAARQLTYYRPGFYLRELLQTTAGLKTWLFAAIRLVSPQFPISNDLAGPVREALTALNTGLVGPYRQYVNEAVTTLIQSDRQLDLKAWVRGVDLTADRAAFVLAHDLQTARDLIQASAEGSVAPPSMERMNELLLYSVSEDYLQLRKKLGIAIT